MEQLVEHPRSTEEIPQLPQQRLVWVLLIAAIVALFGAAFVSRFNAQANKLPVHKQISDFSLTDQSGKEVTFKSLKGHVWIAGFIFTRCAGTCQAITNGMVDVNKKLADEPRIQLISFSMDPDYDKPAILDVYAKEHAARSPRWHFLTGNKDEIFRLTRDDFTLAIQEKGLNKDEPILHSSLLALVDRHGRVRGYYSGIMPEEVEKAATDARALEHELDVFSLPALNATLNGICCVFLLVGYVLIRKRRILAHQTLMMAAGVTSAAFLTSYLVYHYNVGSVRFLGQGHVRYVYFFVLITHIVLAAAIAVLVPLTFWRAFQGKWERHKRIAKLTFPIWLYVSITGVVVYVMLYQLYLSA